jgi:hypothetical protein
LPLSEKVRIEIFIPDLPDPIYDRILEEFSDELSYAFGGCTITSSSGKYRSASGIILPVEWEKDRSVITQYAEELRDIIQRALEGEEAILITVNSIYHVE